MENNREQEKLKNLLRKNKVYLSFSSSFIAISFPLIFSLYPTSRSLESLILLSSLFFFVISTLFSLFTFNGLNKFKYSNEDEKPIKEIDFYSVIIDHSNHLNMVGLVLIVIFLRFITSENVFLMITTVVITVYSYIVFKGIKRRYINSRVSKWYILLVVLGYLVILIVEFILIFIPYSI